MPSTILAELTFSKVNLNIVGKLRLLKAKSIDRKKIKFSSGASTKSKNSVSSIFLPSFRKIKNTSLVIFLQALFLNKKISIKMPAIIR
jgi:hypothetical protein